MDALLDIWANKIELIVTERVGAISLSQENGESAPHLEVRLKGVPRSPVKPQLFSTAFIRGASFSGTYDTRPDGHIVLGFIRLTDRELEVAFAVPESRFPSFVQETSLISSAEIRVTVWPFEDLSSWNGEEPLLLREIEILSISSGNVSVGA
jgi:hypothetical protein